MLLDRKCHQNIDHSSTARFIEGISQKQCISQPCPKLIQNVFCFDRTMAKASKAPLPGNNIIIRKTLEHVPLYALPMSILFPKRWSCEPKVAGNFTKIMHQIFLSAKNEIITIGHMYVLSLKCSTGKSFQRFYKDRVERP